MQDLIRPLRHRTFAWMWGAMVAANLGFWVQDTTLAWLIAGLTASPSLVALVPVMALFPTFLLSLPAGALGDAMDRRRLLIGIQILLIVSLTVFAIALARDWVTIGFILVFALAAGILNGISGPARQAILPSVVPPEDVRGAVLLSSMGYNGSRAVGPMIGGFLLAAFGPLWAVLTYAAACMGVAVVLIRWRSPRKAHTPLRLWPDIRAGLSYVLGQETLRRPLLTAGLYFVCVAPLWAFVPIVARSFAGGDSSVFGLFMMAVGLGSVLGGFSRHLNGAAGFTTSLRNGAALTAMSFAGIALSDRLLVSLASFLLAGIGWLGVSAGINTHMLTTADAAFRTRSIALVMIAFSGGLSVGSLIWGQVGRIFGIDTAFIVAATFIAVLAVATGLRQRRGARPAHS